MKNPACASEQDVLELVTLRYVFCSRCEFSNNFEKIKPKRNYFFLILCDLENEIKDFFLNQGFNKFFF